MPKKVPGSSSGTSISGTPGNDTLSGIGPSFRLSGSRGDDIYYVDDSGDSVSEKNNGGTDTVIASVNWTLSDDVENLTLSGTDDLSGYGNSDANVITGNSGDNLLDGGDGNDLLSGGDGDDTLIGGGGSDGISGGSGTDTAVFSGSLSDYRIEGTATSFTVTSLATGDIDDLDSVEHLEFDDGTYAVADLLAPPTPPVPVAADDAVMTDEDTAVVISVLENDSQGLTLVAVWGNTKGSVVINTDGTLTYTPDANETGLDELTYSAVDANGVQTTAKVSVDIAPVNDAPEATDDTLTVSPEAQYFVATSVLDNDADIDGDSLSVAGAGAAPESMQILAATDSSLTITTTGGGTVELFRDGNYNYTPAAGFVGIDSFVYMAADDYGATATATVTIDVQDGTESVPPPDESQPAPYYVEGLIYGEPNRLNAGDDVGTAVVVTYAFLDAAPDYYASDTTFASTFEAFTLEQQEATRALLADIAELTNITFVETSAEYATLAFGLADLEGFTGLAYRPEGTEVDSTASDVWIDADYATMGFEDGSRALLTLMHEVGHALGLTHATLPDGEENQQYTIMDSTSNPTFLEQPSFYQLYDIAALQYLYGSNETTATGDDVYTFADLADKTTVIWDAGGTDTIDLSGAEYSVQIDLNAGAFSDVASYGWNNLTIAFGSVIENATGGAFDDVISGNDAANVINGGGGDDVLSGGAGSDIFEFASAWGNDTVLDFMPETDMLDLSQSGSTFDDLEISYADGDATVSFAGDSILLIGVDAVDPGMFYFV